MNRKIKAMSIALCVLLITAVFSGAAGKTMKETDMALLTTTVAQLKEECGCSTTATQIELLAGEEDGFDPDSDIPPASPSLELQALFGPNEVGFDYPVANEKFIHTFTWQDCGNITGACLEVKLRFLGDAITNDRFNLLFSNDGYQISYRIWETTPSAQIETILLDLSGLPAAETLITATTSGSVDLLPMLNNEGYLDLYIQDDTSVDYAKLILCCEQLQPCQPTDCGIINGVATNPANWTPNWTGTNITPETIITFQECDGEVYTLYGYPGLVAANNENNENITLHNYGDCQCAKYCWIEVDGKKIIQQWNTLPSDECCDQCCEYCCEIDFTFIGSPIGGGSGSDGPPSLCPGEILTYEYHLTNDGSYDVKCYFSDPSPAGNVYYPSPFTVGDGETETIYIHYQMPGNYGDTCAQQSYIFSHVLNVTIIDTDQGNVECAPIKTSVHIDCHKCPQITCCDGISGLFSGENMQMKDDNGNWIPINIIQWNSNMDFGNLDDQLHYNCDAEWVYGIHDWDSPSSNHEQYKLDFTIPNGECYEIAFTACVDDAAIFGLETPDGVTEFFDTTELLTPSGTYSNFYACFESGENGEMEYCLPPGDYTLHIEHWNTEGSSYGLIFAATKCNPCDCQYEPCMNPSISVEKKVSSDGGQTWHEEVEQCVCQNVQVKITVTNDGDSPLNYVNVSDHLSNCLEYQQGSADPEPYSVSNNYIGWSFPTQTLQPGYSIEITYTAHVVCTGESEDTVHAKGKCDNQIVYAEDSAVVTGEECGSCVDITKKVVDPDTGQSAESIEVPVGTEVTFLITFCNCGTSDLHEIKVVDEFPDCLEYVDSTHPVSSISGNQVVWDFSSLTLHPGDCYKIKVKAKVVSQGENKNCVEVHASSQGGSVSDEDCATVTGVVPPGPCVDITKKVWDPDTGQWVESIEVPVGTEVTFLISFCNCGTSDLHEIQVGDEFPDCLEYVDSTHPVSSINGNQVVWDFSSLTLHPGDCYKIKVTAEVVSQGNCENCVEVYASSQGGSVSDEDCATVIGAPGGSCLGTILVIFLLCGGLFIVHRKKA